MLFFRRLHFLSLLLLSILTLVACSQPPIPTVPTAPAAVPTSAGPRDTQPSPSPNPDPTPTDLPPPTPTPTPGPIPYLLSANLPPDLRQAWMEVMMGDTGTGRDWQEVDSQEEEVTLAQVVTQAGEGDILLAERIYAVVAPFATVEDDISEEIIRAGWLGEGDRQVYVTTEAALPLEVIYGEFPANVVAAADLPAVLAESAGAIGIFPFEALEPTWKALSLDGASVLAKDFDSASYPLRVAVVASGPEAEVLAARLAGIAPTSNRRPERMTQLIMTGVTAMSRGTAEKMEEKGYTYPAAVISDTLAAADITHISNEVPFIDGCPVNNTYMNLILCSDYPYWQNLEAVGTDIVGLSGNHVNDYGREGALESLAFYRQQDIPIYGSGRDEEEACQPLRWEHGGNTFAFLAALAWWPEEAWATATEPGACYLYNDYPGFLARVEALSQEVDVLSVELQYWETYDPWPIRDQVIEFRQILAAGADIVTGVQSHVPQAVEPYAAMEGGPAIILYGLGNLFFDQMQSWETRTGLIARHTIYDGRLISSEILTSVLEDFAQPRWADTEERAEILQRIFAAAPDKDELPPEPTPSPAPTAEVAETPEPQAETIEVTEDSAPAVPASETPLAAGARLGPIWPSPVPQPEDHYWLARPTPLEANRLASPLYGFGSTANGRYRVHHGVDIANPVGTPLLAPDNATVVYAGPDGEDQALGPYPDFYGKTVFLILDRTWRDQPVYVLYGHMNEIGVTSGDRVSRGQPLGTVGMTGIAIGPHVHVEVRLGGTGYTRSHNAELWLEPLPGLGTIAGQVVTTEGRAWQNGRVFIYQTDGGRRLYRIIDLYADDPGIQPDPDWAETFLLADVPAGGYELAVRLDDRTFKQNLEVVAGGTNYARFVIDP